MRHRISNFFVSPTREKEADLEDKNSIWNGRKELELWGEKKKGDRERERGETRRHSFDGLVLSPATAPTYTFVMYEPRPFSVSVGNW